MSAESSWASGPGGRAIDAEVPSGEPAPKRPEPRSRLVVELTRTNASDLEELVELEELNKTTIVNRALQMYAFIRRAEREKGQILLLESGESTPQRLRFL